MSTILSSACPRRAMLLVLVAKFVFDRGNVIFEKWKLEDALQFARRSTHAEISDRLG